MVRNRVNRGFKKREICFITLVEVFGDQWKAVINLIHNHFLSACLNFQAFGDVITLTKQPIHIWELVGDKPFIKALSIINNKQ